MISIEAQAQEMFKPFLDFVAGVPADYTVTDPVKIIAVPARHWWDPSISPRTCLRRSFMIRALAHRTTTSGGPAIEARSAASSTATSRRGCRRRCWPTSAGKLNEVLFAASRHWRVALHYNKGLAGAPPDGDRGGARYRR